MEASSKKILYFTMVTLLASTAANAEFVIKGNTPLPPPVTTLQPSNHDTNTPFLYPGVIEPSARASVGIEIECSKELAREKALLAEVASLQETVAYLESQIANQKLARKAQPKNSQRPPKTTEASKKPQKASSGDDSHSLPITLHFAFGKTVPKGEVDTKALAMQAMDSERVLIFGFTDSKGSVEANRRVATKRAQWLKNELIKNGVPSSRIIVRGVLGDYVGDNNTTQGRAANRRVELNFG